MKEEFDKVLSDLRKKYDIFMEVVGDENDIIASTLKTITNQSWSQMLIDGSAELLVSMYNEKNGSKLQKNCCMVKIDKSFYFMVGLEPTNLFMVHVAHENCEGEFMIDFHTYVRKYEENTMDSISLLGEGVDMSGLFPEDTKKICNSLINYLCSDVNFVQLQ